MTSQKTAAACAHLASRDPVMARLIEVFGCLTLADRDRKTSFGALSRMIIGQQLSSKAAATIFGRYCQLLPKGDHHAHEHVLQLNREKLREVGLSGSKARFILELAAAAKSKSLPEIQVLKKMEENEVRATLQEFYGVGAWTVEMFLIFVLQKENILSLGDAGLRRGFEKAYGKPANQLEEYGEVWTPHCSTASLYLWKIADNPEELESTVACDKQKKTLRTRNSS